MSHPGIEYVGDWTDRERAFVERTVKATDDYLNAHMPRPWRFEKGADCYRVSQPSLWEGERRNLGDLLERIRREAVKARPWTY